MEELWFASSMRSRCQFRVGSVVQEQAVMAGARIGVQPRQVPHCSSVRYELVIVSVFSLLLSSFQTQTVYMVLSSILIATLLAMFQPFGVGFRPFSKTSCGDSESCLRLSDEYKSGLRVKPIWFKQVMSWFRQRCSTESDVRFFLNPSPIRAKRQASVDWLDHRRTKLLLALSNL
jgi:hypothetical protein